MPQILSCVWDPVFLSVGCDRKHPRTGSNTEDAGLPWDKCERNSQKGNLGIICDVGKLQQ